VFFSQNSNKTNGAHSIQKKLDISFTEYTRLNNYEWSSGFESRYLTSLRIHDQSPLIIGFLNEEDLFSWE